MHMYMNWQNTESSEINIRATSIYECMNISECTSTLCWGQQQQQHANPSPRGLHTNNLLCECLLTLNRAFSWWYL